MDSRGIRRLRRQGVMDCNVPRRIPRAFARVRRILLVYRGAITIWTEKGNIELQEGEGYTVPKGVKHKPFATTPSYVLMVDAEVASATR